MGVVRACRGLRRGMWQGGVADIGHNIGWISSSIYNANSRRGLNRNARKMESLASAKMTRSDCKLQSKSQKPPREAVCASFQAVNFVAGWRNILIAFYWPATATVEHQHQLQYQLWLQLWALTGAAACGWMAGWLAGCLQFNNAH